jgi:hypothetical protein
MDLVSDRCSGLVQAGEVESRGLHGPARRAVPARETAPYILMGIDADRHAECVRLPDHCAQVLQIPRPPRARDAAVIEESPADVRGPIRSEWHLAGAAEIDAAQHERAAVLVNETVPAHPHRSAPDVWTSWH